MSAKRFTVCLLFDSELKNVLLVKKSKTEFKGRLNGCGGEIEDSETAYSGALREIREETGLCPKDLREFANGLRLLWLGTLQLPHNCKYPGLSGNELHPPCTLVYYAGIVKSDVRPVMTVTLEELGMYPVTEIINSSILGNVYAGNGDLQYFVTSAMHRLGET